MTAIIFDHAARQRALDVGLSFIVEAPAGSGKTELLVQRYLSLLAQAVRSPEEILAITFTRKAAHEMRCRIINALQDAQKGEASKAQHTTVELAQQVLAKDAKLNWQLLGNPNRLCIQTIDALCMRLAQKMPIISGLGGGAQVAALPDEIYQKSIRAVLDTLDEKTPWQHALITLFKHFDNQQGLIEKTLLEMLKKREAWLPYVMKAREGHDLRAQFEGHLQQIVLDTLSELEKNFPLALQAEVLPLLRYAAQHVEDNGSALKGCDAVSQLHAKLDDLPYWLGVVELLLTQAGDYRKQVTKNLGFPAPSSLKDKVLQNEARRHKEAIQNLLESLTEADALKQSLVRLRVAPPLHYSNTSWDFLQALLTVLPITAAQLMLHFQHYGQVDFIEVASRALHALGESEAPTDLALVLDYQLQHILVDEFQDTSLLQFRLLEKMVSAWQADDGRTLFLVGDPMQSIYRFRQAEVGLFLQAAAQGIGPVRLEALQLGMNFRSQPLLIHWINQVMPHIMPRVSAVSSGAIAFTPCQPARIDESTSRVQMLLMQDPIQEAQVLIEQIEQIKSEQPQASIAILVRARSHLTAILPQLKIAGIAYQALEIEPLLRRECIHDLLALTRALLHFHDRIAWLALLRGPWCGLTLAELECLALAPPSTALWQTMQDPIFISQLPEAAQQRLARTVSALSDTLNARDRLPLSAWVKSAWLAMGGMHHTPTNEEEDCIAFFHALEVIEQQYSHIDFNTIEHYLARLYTHQLGQGQVVQVMTMHKAKGLEFDVVFLPGLSRKNAVSEPPLLRFNELSVGGDTHWLLAPIGARTAQTDPIYHYLGQIEKTQQAFEAQRLLYVALTRAKQQLYLCAVHDDLENPPAQGSLFALLYPHSSDIMTVNKEKAMPQESVPTPTLRRIARSWQLPPFWYEKLYTQVPATLEENCVDTQPFESSAIMRRMVGTLLHRAFKYLAENPQHRCASSLCERFLARWPMHLQTLGLEAHQLQTALDLLTQGLTQTLKCQRGLWILQPHEAAANEFALHTYVNNQHRALIMDRTFVENAERWIIDYKTSLPTGNIEAFLQQDVPTHIAQLQYYAQVMQKIDKRPIRLGLYYPLISAWRELT